MSWFRYHILRKTFCDHRPPTRTHTHAGTCVCMCAHTCHTCRHMRPHTHMHARTHGGPASHSAPLGIQLSHSTSAPFLVTCCHVHGATDARGQPTTALSFSRHRGGCAASWERQGLHTAVPHQTCVPSASGAARGQPPADLCLHCRGFRGELLRRPPQVQADGAGEDGSHVRCVSRRVGADTRGAHPFLSWTPPQWVLEVGLRAGLADIRKG